MKAQDIMNRDVYKVDKTASVRSVIELFLQHGISGVPVVNEKDEMKGYVSDGDIMRYIGKHEDWVIGSFNYVFYIPGDDVNFDKRVERLLNLPVTDLATRKVITVNADEDVERIASILGNKHIKKLPVLQGGKLVGIISRGDVIRHSFKALL